MKKFLSLLLAVIMAVSVLPVTAIAAEADSLDLLPLGEPAAQEAEKSKAASPFKEFELRVGSGKYPLIKVNTEDPGYDRGDFSADKFEYNFTVPLQVWSMNQRLICATPTSETAKVTAQVGDGSILEVGKEFVDLNDITYGGNVLKVTVTDGGDSITYTFNILCEPRAVINDAVDKEDNYYPFYTEYIMDDDHEIYDTGDPIQNDYYVFVNETVKELIFTYGASDEYTVSFNGTKSLVKKATVPIDGVNKIVVRTETIDKKYFSEYNVNIIWLGAPKQTFEIPEGASLRVWNSQRTAIETKEGDPYTYVGLTEGETYYYAVIKEGCVSVSGSFVAKANSSAIVVMALEAAPANTHKLYNGEWTNFRGSDDNMAIRSAKTPTTAKYTKLKWAVKMGTDMWMSPTPPIILNDMEVDGVKRDVLVCAMAKNIYMLDKETGEVLKSAPMKGSAGFATNPLTYADGLIFAQLDSRIQAFDATTLESVWISEQVGGQTVSPITYHNGYVYIGLWNGEKENGTFACFSVVDEKPDETDETKYATWTLTHKGGFYWAGAYATDNYVVFGSDDGTSEGDYTANAILYSVNPKTGEIIDTIEGIKGDIRSTVAYYEGACYAVTKGGLFLKAPISADGHFDHDAFKTVDMGNMCTSTPIIYKGKAFIGTSGAQQFGSPGTLNVIDVNTMTIVENVTLPGYPQAPMLMSTGYEEETGEVYIYTTYNAPPGGLYCVTWNTNDDTFSIEHMFIPESSMRQYCLGSPICDSDGTIYYKNDSGYLFALEVDNEAVAKDVVDLINAIGDVTKDSGDAIKAAREAYDELTPEQKALVPAEVLAKLVKAEQIYSMIVDSNKPDASDKGDKTESIIKISATGAAKGEQNPNTGAEVFGE